MSGALGELVLAVEKCSVARSERVSRRSGVVW
jgi:hypothetical protein